MDAPLLAVVPTGDSRRLPRPPQPRSGRTGHALRPAQRLPALGYIAELRLRTSDRDAAAALPAEVDTLGVPAAGRAALATGLSTATEPASELR